MNRAIATVLVVFASVSSGLSTALAAPLTYEECAEKELSDKTCHQRIIEAGGESSSAPEESLTDMVTRLPQDTEGKTFIVLRDEDGNTMIDRWYARYVNYARHYGAQIYSRSAALEYYPGYPPFTPPGFN